MEGGIIVNKIEVLQNCRVEGNIVKLPDTQLDRKVYLEVKKSLELIGGKWKGGKTYGFVFHSDPSELLLEVSKGSDINLKKEYQFFATPKSLARKLVKMAEISEEDKILEPSAGQGAIIEQINEVTDIVPDCFEIMDTNKIILEKSDLRFNLLGDDFLESDNKEYTKIIANPPFSKNRDIAHVYKMYEKLAYGGRIVTMMSRHWQKSTNKKEKGFKEFLDRVGARVIEVDAGEFKESGTLIATVIVIIDKTA